MAWFKSNKNNRSRQGKGFSLVELLTSIGIIGVLTAITLPAINRAKTIARVHQCQAEQNTLYKNLNMFMYDAYPSGADEDKLEQDNGRRANQLLFNEYFTERHNDAYLGEGFWRYDLMNCPDTQEAQTTAPFTLAAEPDEDNPTLEDYENGAKILSSRLFSLEAFVEGEDDYGNPNQEVVWEPCHTRDMTYKPFNKYPAYHKRLLPEKLLDMSVETNTLHRGYKGKGANYTYADGHAEWRTAEEIYNTDNRQEMSESD